MNCTYTSESVGEGHPDKVADAISDTVVDYFMEQQSEQVRCACETLVTKNRVIIAGEYKGEFDVNTVEQRVRETVRAIGYQQPGFDADTLEFTNLMHGQSADIALGTDSFGAGDQGTMIGYACDENDAFMPEPIYLSHLITRRLAAERRNGTLPWLGPDCKSQVTLLYENGLPSYVDSIVCSTQHDESINIEEVRQEVSKVIKQVIPVYYLDRDSKFYINPTGRFVLGGPAADTGLTGRKLAVDTYGGRVPHGGGAFSGKDPTKMDRTAAYMARYLAKNLVASGRTTIAAVALSYAIGIKEPVAVTVIGDSQSDHDELKNLLLERVDLSTKAIIDRFDLFQPIYHNTTNYGHFGRADLPWERIDLF